ncbi:MAG: hypothetical protein FJY88_04775 [Candidatus Eisenbacteria bacterium]|nr:hypothetical protein [Candidatus Eisenbacteria bacterium]
MTPALSTLGSRGSAAIVCALLALAIRLPFPTDPDAARAWTRGALALQGLRQAGEVGEARTELLVTIPLALGQNAAYAASAIAGEAAASNRSAWIRERESLSRAILAILWTAAAGLAAGLAARQGPGLWGWLAGFLAACAPIGIAGSQRLEGWALAAPLALIVSGPGRHRLHFLLWSFILSLTPLGIVLAALGLILGGRARRLAVLLSLPIWFGLEPGRLTAPVEAISRLPFRFIAAGWPGIGDGPAGRLLVASWTPGVVVLVLCATGGLLLRREATARLRLAWIASLWLLPAILGARRPDAVGLAVPVAAALSSVGAEAIHLRARRNRAGLRAALAIGIVLPVAWGAQVQIRAQLDRSGRAAKLAETLAREVGRSGLLLRDASTPEAPDSIPSFVLPTHIERPERWDFAHWPGWFGPFTHALFTARSLDAIRSDISRRPAGAALLRALALRADPIVSVGDPATDRGALVLFRLREGHPWRPEEGFEEWKKIKGGAEEARFLSDLAGFLAGNDRQSQAIDLLRLAIKWDPRNPRLWNNLGSALLMEGEAVEAAEALQEGLDLEPRSVELRYNLAKAFLAGNIPGRAAIELSKVIRDQPGFAPAHYELARAAAAEGNWALAAQALETYLRLQPAAPNREQVASSLAEARRRAGEGRRGQ